MHISRQISGLLVLNHDSIRHALELINANRKGMVVCVDDTGVSAAGLEMLRFFEYW